MADAGDQRERKGGDIARQRFVVETPQVFERTAAAHQQHDVALPVFDYPFERGAYLRRRGLALHRGRVDDHRDVRRAPGDDRQHVADRGAGGRRDQRDAARVYRRGLLARRIEQALGGEARLQLFEAAHQFADAGVLEMLDDELVPALRLVERRLRPDQNLLPVLRLEGDAAVGVAEHGRTDLRLVVLEREVPVTGRGAR